ncbi:MAG TPA: DHA2 family efflux MFS transporter permease subunit [Geminicoccus sp.]|uniref:DHA2 family efflux MFS transporter permease subunit n=1 Tax=Geminicoccus sp. TaxID=2024832 RepID=UPI002D1B2704|nr:DHA2 family efflux MFS transporter permease subunit [Geminicoccus sp.]HWL71833.1 DHA2 family efflux MFS transporter permease subunit [Geminicoccus sp.]
MSGNARQRLVIVVVAAALFMENLDSTVLVTALPTIAADFGTDPVNLKLALTTYLVSLAVCVPASGWIADRFGARRVFTLAIVLFCTASLLCSLAGSVPELVAGRALQGVGGALMVPVGRLVILRLVPKHELVGAMAWFTMPALIGPLLGPPVGGFIVTVADWRWIFWINLPVGALALVAAWFLMPRIAARDVPRFDLRGFVLLAVCLASVVAAEAFFGTGDRPLLLAGLLALTGLVTGWLYVRHALRSARPLLDLRLLRIDTFRAGMLGGFLFRAGAGATPFLLPLLLQLALGLDPLTSGLTTFATAFGAFLMKPLARPVLDRFGFRQVLIVNVGISAALLVAPILFGHGTPWLVMVGVLVLAGLTRSLQFTSLNTLAMADLADERQSQGTSTASVVQQVSASMGVTIAAVSLDLARWLHGAGELGVAEFRFAFLCAGLVALSALPVFLALPADAGAALVRGGIRGPNSGSRPK